MPIRIEERFITHAGGLMRYLVVGEGPPLLMVHGWNGSAENFETWYEEVGKVRQLILPDLPGFGESTHYPGRHTAKTLGMALDAVLLDAGARRVDLGGLCLGACVALSFYRRRPEMVDKLILHTPLIAPPYVTGQFHRHIRFLTAAPVFPVATVLGRRRWISDWYKRHFTEGVVEEDTGADINFINQVRCEARASKEWLRDGLYRHDVDLIEQRSDPTMILMAGDDNIVDVPAISELAATLPGVTLAVFENAGHGWGQDLVRRQNAALVAFLEGRDVADAGELQPSGHPLSKSAE